MISLNIERFSSTSCCVYKTGSTDRGFRACVHQILYVETFPPCLGAVLWEKEAMQGHIYHGAKKAFAWGDIFIGGGVCTGMMPTTLFYSVHCSTAHCGEKKLMKCHFDI